MAMLRETKRTCNVCRKLVRPHRGDLTTVVANHQDKAGNHCEMSGERFDLTEPYLPRPVSTWERTA